ncbi:MAG: hypothetical protein ACRDJE_28090 [Dehalococcoidia bacterium]
MNPDHPIAPPRIDPAKTSFRETVAFKRYGTIPDPDPRAVQDLYLRELIRQQGFDRLPHAVPRRTLDRYIAAGEIELFRGLSAAWHADEFRMGDFFVGRGTYGGGASVASGPDALAMARVYARGGIVMRLSLKRGAHVTEYDALVDRAFHDQAAAARRIQEEETEAVAMTLSDGDEAAVARLHAAYRTAREVAHAQHDDIGRLGAYLGYDAIHVADADFYVILNRTAVRVQAENMR